MRRTARGTCPGPFALCRLGRCTCRIVGRSREKDSVRQGTGRCMHRPLGERGCPTLQTDRYASQDNPAANSNHQGRGTGRCMHRPYDHRRLSGHVGHSRSHWVPSLAHSNQPLRNKSTTSGGTPPSSVWQRNYHDRIIRNDAELDRIRQYIHDNPGAWDHDRENPAYMPSPGSANTTPCPYSPRYEEHLDHVRPCPDGR
jgi:hypothetical protein